MYIILGKEAAERLRENYLVLDLETVMVKGEAIPAYCVVEGEGIPLVELPQIDQYRDLHANFVIEYNKGNYKFCLDAAEHLRGKFGGQLDTFYDEIVARIENNLSKETQ